MFQASFSKVSFRWGKDGKAFGWEWKINWRRTENRSAENGKSFGAEIFVAFCKERGLKDDPSILHVVMCCMIMVYCITWRMKGYFANFLGDGGQPHVPVGTLVFFMDVLSGKKACHWGEEWLNYVKKRLVLVFFFHFVLFIEYLLYLYVHNNPIKSETLY